MRFISLPSCPGAVCYLTRPASFDKRVSMRLYKIIKPAATSEYGQAPSVSLELFRNVPGKRREGE